jgi:hypothetical protein
MVKNEEVATQINVFLDAKNQDADEISHKYENVQYQMEYPLQNLVDI